MRKQPSGFTLLELIITVGIFTMVTGVLIANLRGGEQLDQLRLQGDLLASQLRRSQGQAVAGINGTTVNGYGIAIDAANATQYIVFSDSRSSGALNRYDSGEETETVNLPDNMEMTVPSSVDIVFSNPTGAVYRNGVLTQSIVTSTMTHTSISKSVDVVILPLSGQVSVSQPY